MVRRKPESIRSSEITPETVYLNRRRLLGAGVGLGALAASGGLLATPLSGAEQSPVASGAPAATGFVTDEPATPWDIVTSYNNFYEFGMNKGDPARYAHEMTIEPWSLEVGGLCGKPGRYALEKVIGGLPQEDRIYRFRCVEAWSMVVPWLGIQLSRILERFEPAPGAKFVEFTTLYRPKEMRGQRSLFSSIDWPYVEGLRMDEAYHPLALMAVGIYGKPLPNQNGAPLRLVVPWKYGFKSIKSIVGIRFTDRQPETTWQRQAANEYGFYANVNPAVDHPRWSQATERRLPSSLFDPNRIPTLPFNGYGSQVAHLYEGMDLRRNF